MRHARHTYFHMNQPPGAAPAQQPAPQFQVPPTQVIQEQSRQFQAPPPPPPQAQQPAQAPTQQPPTQPSVPQITMDAVFPNDPNLPPELRGRPVRDALDAYQTMRQDFLQRNGIAPAPQVPQAPRPQAPQQPPQQPAQRPAAQGQQPAAAAANPRDSFFRDPEAAINSAVERAIGGLMQQLQPVLQDNTQTRVDRALDTVRREFPDFAQHEGFIMSTVRGMPPELLSDPNTFRNAYKLALGEAALRSRQGGQVAPPTRWVPANGQAPQAAAPSFFTETPTPAAGQVNAQGFTPQVLEMARRFGMPPEEYVLWSGGQVPSQGGNNGR